jgi:hypothetical protein
MQFSVREYSGDFRGIDFVMMVRISEKLEFMMNRPVKVCTKTVTVRSPKYKNPCVRANF